MTRILILTSTFLSAFLLFIVQPLYAKFLLPFFGGTSSVWTISVFFYSVTLLVGYIYAALLISWPSRTARLVHSLLLILAGTLLLSRWVLGDSPLLVDAVFNLSPAVSVLLTLLMGAGLPVLLLASTSVVTQHLYARLTAEEPYKLYALSNTGSLLGLAAYPFLLEPFTSISFQSVSWAVLFIIFLVTLLSAWRQVGMVSVRSDVSAKLIDITFRHRWAILFLASVPTFMLVTTTEFLSKGIASFPLMWVIPLMLYLTSFIVSFRDKPLLKTKIPFGFLTLVSLFAVCVLLPFINISTIIYWVVSGFVILSFFLLSVYFHDKIYSLRPKVADLGSFYIWLTLGGALGSGIVGLLLPVILNSQIEIYISFGLLLFYFSTKYFDWFKNYVEDMLVSFTKIMVCLGSIIFVVYFSHSSDSQTDRNFFGTLKSYNIERSVDGKKIDVKIIENGTIIHGFQAQDDRYYQSAASYYSPGSGIDIAIRSFTDNDISPRINVVGLGAGMINSYCRDVSKISYIEINPAVERFAVEHFTYLEICPEKTSVKIGDGRLLLEQEVLDESIEYDVIMMDAFTDDAIPSHLLTIEAFEEAYKPLLSENGVIAFHVTNRYLKLYKPVIGMARASGFDGVVVQKSASESNELIQESHWVLVTRPENIETLLGYENATVYNGPESVWTDDKSSVMSVLSLTGSRVVE
jgi:MFS family permease